MILQCVPALNVVRLRWGKPPWCEWPGSKRAGRVGDRSTERWLLDLYDFYSTGVGGQSLPANIYGDAEERAVQIRGC